MGVGLRCSQSEMELVWDEVGLRWSLSGMESL